MSHIEFIGPSGSGKTALYQRLITDEQFYGGVEDGALSRWLLTSSSWKRRLFGKYLPKPLRPSHITRMLEYEFRDEAVTSFLTAHPSYLREVHRLVTSVEHQPERVIKFVKRAATQYQMGYETRQRGERLCCDELFFMLLASSLWRMGGDSIQVGSFIEAVPTPAVLVYVTAPLDVCLERQRERSRMAVKEPWVTDERTAQQEHAEVCHNVVAEAKELDIQVLEIDNGGQLEDAERTLRSELADISA